MFGSEILEVAIGLVFVYLVTSLVATAVREAIEGILKTRAIHLERGIRQLLDDPSGTIITKQLFDHPMLFALFAGEYEPSKLTTFFLSLRRGGGTTNAQGSTTPPKRAGFCTNLPAYIPSGNFALALMHVVAGTGTNGTAGVLTIASVRNGTMLLPEGRVKQAMLLTLGEAQGDLDRARASLESWYDGTMDRVSGWYKRETSWILFGLGLIIAVALNVDSLHIARSLATNNTLRQQLVAKVDATYRINNPNAPPGEGELKNEVVGLSNVIGYDELKERVTTDVASKVELKNWKNWQIWLWYLLLSVPGWLISALAISLGAPFWFDVLNKLMVIRSTVKPYEKSGPEASADRGSATRTDALAPDGMAANVKRDTRNAEGRGGAVPGRPPPNDAAATIVTPTASLRLAFEGADPGTMTLTSDGLQATVPPDGFVELPLEVGIPHIVKAAGTSAGGPVEWSATFVVAANDDQRPVVATLA